MKIILATPLMKERRADLQYIPLGLAYIASALKNSGHEVSVLDVRAERLAPAGILQRINKASPRLFAITSNTCQIHEAADLLALVKKNFPGLITVLGGPHISALPERTLREQPALDIGVVGEGEVTAVELCAALDRGEKLHGIPGLVFRDGADIVLNPARPMIADINSIKFPDRDAFPTAIYNSHIIEYKAKPIASIITTRGCPYQCTFCCKSVFGSRQRLRSPENVIAELQELIENKHYREIHVIDDNFTFDTARAKTICNEIIARKWNVSFALPNGIRVNNFDDALAGLMKKAGFYSLWFGVESGSQEVLDRIKKGLRLDQVRKAVTTAKRHGFFTGMYFIIGLPGSSPQSEEMSLALARELEPDVMGVGIFTPYPGSELYDSASASDWAHYRHDFAGHHFTGGQFDTAYILRQFDMLSQRFYFRPSYYTGLVRRHGMLGVRRVWINFKNFLFRRLGL
jgi:anaerobic magnesium-protoporphyrin IX monomethyl ester cyclase